MYRHCKNINIILWSRKYYSVNQHGQSFDFGVISCFESVTLSAKNIDLFALNLASSCVIWLLRPTSLSCILVSLEMVSGCLGTVFCWKVNISHIRKFKFCFQQLLSNQALRDSIIDWYVVTWSHSMQQVMSAFQKRSALDVVLRQLVGNIPILSIMTL